MNPGSVILSGEMMLEHIGWTEAADLIIKGMEKRDRAEDRHLRLRPPMEGAKEVKCSEFGRRHHRRTCRDPLKEN